MSSSDEITLIVVEPDPGANADDGEGLPADSFEPQSIEDVKQWFRGKPKQVKLSALRERMAEVQGEVDQLLASMRPSTSGYHLTEVQVSLAISGSGSIGVATVGAEASIALTFAPPARSGAV